jgi:hypothetical protein
MPAAYAVAVERIPCYVLAFHDAPTIAASLDWLARWRDRLELIVLENPSEATASAIRPDVEARLARGEVDRYLLFDENISNNAFEVALAVDRARWEAAPYVLLTDGDLVGGDGWLEEEVALMDRRPEVFAVGIRLDMDNLPLAQFPDAGGWVPPPRAEHDDHHEGLTGIHLLMLRGADLAAYMRYQAANRLRFVDSTMHHFAYRVLDRRWARTARSSARHLTWDLYAQPDHPYTQMKTGRSLREHWHHTRYCGLTEIAPGGERYVPSPL